MQIDHTETPAIVVPTDEHTFRTVAHLVREHSGSGKARLFLPLEDSEYVLELTKA